MPAPSDHSFAAQPTMLGPSFMFSEDSIEPIDPVEAYFECITTCSLDDGDCITTCTEVLRQHGG